MPHVLVPLDGSPLAESALPHAVALARAMQGKLLLFHVVTPVEAGQTLFWHAAAPGVIRREWQQHALNRSQRYVEEIAERVSRYGIVVASEVVEAGHAAEAIVARLQATDTGYGAMATHGRGGLGRWMLGSVADEVIHRVSRPVLIVHATAELGAGTPPPAYRTLLTPLDGSPFGEYALEQTRALAAATGAAVILATIVPPLDDQALEEAGLDAEWIRNAHQAQSARAEDYLRRVAAPLVAAGINVQPYVAAGEAPAGILAACNDVQADMIVMATHGRRGLQQVRLGSVAHRLIQQLTCPVLLVRPG